MNRKMCLYKIQKEPHVALSEAYEENNICFVQDTEGNMKEVDPLYIGPFDASKLYMFGLLVINYFKNNKSSLNKICDMFNIDLDAVTSH